MENYTEQINKQLKLFKQNHFESEFDSMYAGATERQQKKLGVFLPFKIIKNRYRRNCVFCYILKNYTKSITDFELASLGYGALDYADRWEFIWE